jgi:hypothetical protein
MSRFSRCLVILVISHALFLTCAHAHTATVIPANQAAAHVGERSGVCRMDGVNSCVRQLFWVCAKTRTRKKWCVMFERKLSSTIVYRRV